jgi:hypothetical protein
LLRLSGSIMTRDDSVISSGHVRVTVTVPLAGPGRTLVRVIAKPRCPAAARTRRGLGKHEQSAFKFFKEPETTASAAAAGDRAGRSCSGSETHDLRGPPPEWHTESQQIAHNIQIESRSESAASPSRHCPTCHCYKCTGKQNLI